MNAVILCVGKLKEKWQQEGCAEYLKRLSRYGKYEIIAVDDRREPDKPSDALIRQIMEYQAAHGLGSFIGALRQLCKVALEMEKITH